MRGGMAKEKLDLRLSAQQVESFRVLSEHWETPLGSLLTDACEIGLAVLMQRYQTELEVSRLRQPPADGTLKP
jgi:hypothetical protein